MEKIPTAGEFKRMHPKFVTKEISVETLMVEFAKLHVEAALKEASVNAECEEGAIVDLGFEIISASVDKNSILNSYPLSNIK